ncbi:uncharacterized protein EHS24_007278 [Apiotrichum porosum]|uniref:Translation initiation factor eIF2B subunit delta n=1 Tax=Apiotrichum porosum TaxID=105984 RepID=A0A427XXN0_9TREE|nr:uncharacterized protein EHS24_007278 [Apiotrichum porosum]RSH83590.1 hypothetical protein EHS24_007278 [Apiotrichum porosum]
MSSATSTPQKATDSASPPSVGATPTGPTGKPMTAKELKKMKRAAQVAARGPPAVDHAAPGLASPNASAAASPAASAGPSGGTSRHRRGIAAAAAAASAPPPPPNPAHQFFSHLPVPRDPHTPDALASDKIHPVVVRLGVLIAQGTLRGASARTLGVLEAFREVVHDYECPPKAVFWKDFSSHISPMIAYLETCRPKGVGVGNAIRWFKGVITRLGEDDGDHIPVATAEASQKAYLTEAINSYIQDNIIVAGQVIADFAKEKIKAGDTVVVYARSSVVERSLLEAYRDMQARSPPASFSVVVVDSRPLHEGRTTLATLSAAGIPCMYTLLPLASTALSRASLVLLGGSSLNSDGALHSRAGTAVVAMLAKEHRVPVVACIEAFKLSERVGLDDLASNEVGTPDSLLNIPTARALELPKPLPKNLIPLHLLYDLTPPDHITAVCTEVGFIPPSSVPTLLSKGAGLSA